MRVERSACGLNPLGLLQLVFLPGPLQIQARDSVAQAPPRQDQFLARAAVLQRSLQGWISLYIGHETLQLLPALG